MTNIFRIFISDFKRISSNVVAVVVVIGLSVIPCLYAWFNILSNWAPYEKEATSRLSVAVATEDRGIVVEDVELNIGQIVVDNLKSNDSINWQFYDSSYEAIQQVERGDCYAALVVESTFSEDMLSFVGGDLQNPSIAYYENEKKNAIAPKITGKVKTTVQEEVNKAFVSTLAEGLLSVSAYVTSNKDSEVPNLADSALDRMHQMDDDLTTGVNLLNAYIGLLDASSSMMDATKSVTDELGYVEDNSRAMMDSASIAAEAAEDSVGTVSRMASVSFEEVDSAMEALEDTLAVLEREVEKTGRLTTKQAESLKATIASIQSSYVTLTSPVVGKISGEADVAIADIYNYMTEIYNDADAMETAGDATVKDTDKIISNMQKTAKSTRKSLKKLKRDYENVITPRLDATFSQVEKSLDEVETLLNRSGSMIHSLSDVMGTYPDLLNIGTDQLAATRDEILALQKDLQELIADMDELEGNEQYQMLLKLLETDPELIADFVSSPVDIDQQSLYAVENNGSATAPFYIVLSIWVGALIMVAILHTKVKPIEGVSNMRTYEEFFGRYIVFFLIGQLQTLITVLGALYFVGIQCEHKFFFWLGCAITSFSFTLLLYALTYAFEAVGEAVAVVLMVLQVAGSGGTFPVEVLPLVYQLMYRYMPFAYAMNAARECIAGTYQNDYWRYALGLFVYVGVALVIGLFISIPCKKLNAKIKESTEKTDLLL